MKNKFIILLATLQILVSCVGTVKDKNAKSGNITSDGNQSSNLGFNGLSRVNPISHDKVELFFFPAIGDQNSLIYEVYVNSSLTPIPFAPTSLTLNSSGEYRALVSGLNMNSSYSFNVKVKVKNANSASTLDPSKALNTKTFANQTADFLGISSIERMPGALGEDQIKVSWIAAKSIGGANSARGFDPVRYEIKYISSGGPSKLNDPNYLGNDRRIIYTTEAPESGKSTTLEQATFAIIPDLDPATTYYVQIRAIHSNYDAFKFDPLYNHDKNTKYLTITTLGGGDLSSINDTSFKIVIPATDEIPGTLIGQWEPAEGAIFNYKLCYKPITGAEKTAGIDLINPVGTPINFLTNNPALTQINCLNANSALTSLAVNSLNAFSNYQFSLFACITNDCLDGQRIPFDPIFMYFNPPLPPFNGISYITNPDNDAALRDITVNFDPPATSDGYANQMKIYCFNGDNATPFDLTQARTGICSQVIINSTMPTTYPDDFTNFNQIKLTLTDTVNEKLDGVNKYCFKVVPVNSSAPNTIKDDVLFNAPKVCINPQIITPNILQFAGRDFDYGCSVDGDKLKITWSKPTGGLYQGYKVYWKDRSGPDFFSFSNAITETAVGYVPVTTYKAQTIANKNTTEFSIPDLTPGTKYGIGVLTYLYDPIADIYYYSQMNTNVADCSLPLPKAKFNSWMQVLAIGPKENGLDDENTFIAETIDNDFHATPREIEIEPGYIDGSDTNSTYLTSAEDSKLGSVQFDGIYGALTGQTVKQQHSDKGIIKISWEDVNLIGFPLSKDQINEQVLLKDAGSLKKNRTYGYKVFRSSDNKNTWKELTTSGQTDDNKGLIIPVSVNWKKSPQLGNESSYVASFTDYSVEYAGEEIAASLETGIDQARIYYYKIIPVFNGKELKYQNEYGTAPNLIFNPDHNIIKVILPPKNMALVNRMIANKSFCEEIDKTINKGAEKYYTCSYNGLGATGLTFPYNSTSSVYDLGGDLLVDRFELGVRFTRGDKDLAGSTPIINAKVSPVDPLTRADAFDGTSTSGNYIGCFGGGRPDSYLSDKVGSVDHLAARLVNQVGPGDCIADDKFVILNEFGYNRRGNAGANRAYFYIGAGNNLNDLANAELEDGPGCTTCAPLGFQSSDFFNSTFSPYNLYQEAYHPSQSSFGAVHLPRKDGTSALNTIQGFTSPAGNYYTHQTLTGQSNAYINLPYTQDVSGVPKFFPRWFDAIGLFGALRFGGLAGDAAMLFNKTFEQVRSDTRLYQTGLMGLPSYNENKLKNRKLIRHITSNAAKLAPVRGFNQAMLQNTCETYEIKVGFKTDGGTFSTAQSAPLKKRLFHRKEFIAASRWPSNLDEDEVIEVEKGTDPLVVATTLNANNGCNSPGKFTNYWSSRTRQDSRDMKNQSVYNILYPEPNSNTPIAMTGSSLLDNQQNGSGVIENFSTSNCQSRYGIQDLVGNIAEYSSEEIHCNANDAGIFSKTPFNYRYKDTFNVWQNNSSIIYDPNYRLDNNHTIDNGNNIAGQFFGSILEVNGGCSVSAVGPDISSPSGLVGSVYNWDGSLNTSTISSSVVGVQPLDKESFQSVRSGDGTFLSFGPDGILPNLIRGYTSFYADPAIINLNNLKSLKTSYRYFNPAIGLPLACDGASCSNSNDNTYVTFRPDNSNSPGSQVVDYPFGNSSFNLPGLSDIDFQPPGSYFTFQSGTNTPFYFLRSDKVASDLMDDLLMSATASNGSTGVLGSLRTTAKTNNVFGFVNGGASTGSFAGRFSLDYQRTIATDSLPLDRITSPDGINLSFGGRCVIKIID